ncbi:UDP-N-acetylmuramoylalanyl-D-glutamate-2, 6-diaminopimelate ligase [Legionella geestiana]|uniref:UDP-N-acetylmuramoyl-L-alanyl-D-glutamate--2,6-diaminopimelate ligase n=2 Tax=Legionella geestiana TaxID=45065 RepID=A0A0W0TVI3_9GAMM|nr:UDP-N-acetylmuramoylalanyl-D-glutamate-2, 6-diaminopimelate ligase [Legionella geestiana]STX54333.1 UDP-N-acetylmuramoylalanyl-D-glutamate-2, 6-diaminopimelate ligase [Legionella geestiana]
MYRRMKRLREPENYLREASMKLSKLLEPFTTAASAPVDILGLSNDSRSVAPGDAFLAYKGALADGRDYIAKATAAGAAAILFDPENFNGELPEHIPAVPIEHLGARQAELASRFYGVPSERLAITGVTGTNGKTTIACQLAAAHSRLGAACSYIGTLGEGDVRALRPLANTTPDALAVQKLLYRFAEEGKKRVCMEVSSHALVLQRVACVRFESAIFTNLSHEHLDFHHTMDAYARAKAMLFETEGLRTALLNADDAATPFMRQHVVPGCEVLTYGLHNDADVFATDWQSTLGGSRLTVRSPWGKHEIALQSPGEFNLSNGLAVFASLLLAGYPVAEVEAIMPTLAPAPGRLERVASNPEVFVDYAHTPDALENVLKTLSALKQNRVIVVFGCGGDRDKTKRAEMGEIASRYADSVILTSDNPRSESPQAILDDICKGLHAETPVQCIPDRREAIRQALLQSAPDDMVLIAGKGHEATQEIKGVKTPFSDKAVVQALLQVSNA